MKARRIIGDIVIYAILIVMSVLWLAPIVWLFFQSLSGEGGISSMSRFMPNAFTFNNYIGLFTNEVYVQTFNAFTKQNEFVMKANDYIMFFGRDASGNIIMGSFMNTLVVSLITMVISTLLTLGTSYALSRFRFKGRNAIMKTVLVVGMFPGFLSLIILYWMFKLIGIQPSIFQLILVYSAGAGGGYYVSKGFFDTISKQIDEAAMIDGASRSQIFFHIILPLSKPIVIYTALTAFMGPWAEYITASYLIGDKIEAQTVALQLNKVLAKEVIGEHWGYFCAAAIVIAIPTSLLFIFLQKYYVSGVTGGSVKG